MTDRIAAHIWHSQVAGSIPASPTSASPISRRKLLGKRELRGKNKRLLFDVVAARDGTDCHWCDCVTTREPNKSQTATLDHLTPISEGGKNVSANLVIACSWCNFQRGRRPAHTWRLYMNYRRSCAPVVPLSYDLWVLANYLGPITKPPE